MFLLKSRKKRARRRLARGQGITEYGAMIAFVAVLVALTFSIANGHLSQAICAAFSAVSMQLNNMSTYVNSAAS